MNWTGSLKTSLHTGQLDWIGDEENISLLLCITHSDMTVSEAAFDLQTKKLFSCIQKPVGLEIYIYIAMENKQP